VLRHLRQFRRGRTTSYFTYTTCIICFSLCGGLRAGFGVPFFPFFLTPLLIPSLFATCLFWLSRLRMVRPTFSEPAPLAIAVSVCSGYPSNKGLAATVAAGTAAPATRKRPKPFVFASSDTSTQTGSGSFSTFHFCLVDRKCGGVG